MLIRKSKGFERLRIEKIYLNVGSSQTSILEEGGVVMRLQGGDGGSNGKASDRTF